MSDKSTKPGGKKLVLPLLLTFGVLLLLTALFFIPINGRAMTSRVLDATGQHKLALGMDMMYQGKAGQILQGFTLNDLSKPEECKKASEILSNQKIEVQAMSGQAFFKLNPAASNYRDKFNFQYVLNGSFNPETKQASAGVDLQASFDPELFNKIVKEANPNSRDFSLSLIEATADGIMTTDDAYFTVSKLNLKTSDFTSNNALNNYYKASFKNSDAQKETLRKEGVNELINELRSITTFTMGDAFEPATLDLMAQGNCQTIEKMEVKAPLKKSFANSEEKEVRPVVVSLRDNYQETAIEQQSKLTEQLKKDAKLKNFILSKYDNVVRMANAGNKISPEYETYDYNAKPLCEYYDPKTFAKNESCTTQTRYPKITKKAYEVPSKEEYERAVNQYFTSQSPSSNGPSAKEILDQQKEYFSTTNEPTTIYLDAQTGDLSAFETKSTLKLTEKALANFNNSPTLKEILKDGLTLEMTYFDMKTKGQVQDKALPANAKPIEEFTKDIQNTDAGKRLDEISKTEQSSSQSSQEIK